MSKPVRSYLNTKYNKRTRLESEVSKLKRQVAINKKELKYFDLSITDAPIDNYSLFSKDTFYGRKFHVKKIEINFTAKPDHVLIWRTKKPGKSIPVTTSGVPTLWPTGIDPEYHIFERDYFDDRDINKQAPKFIINYGKAGRLVEFDNVTNGTASGTITKGDVLMNASFTTTNFVLANVRVWYTDG